MFGLTLRNPFLISKGSSKPAAVPVSFQTSNLDHFHTQRKITWMLSLHFMAICRELSATECGTLDHQDE